MSGILEQKSRIFDTIITNIGKEQISSGKLVAEYVSFSDMGAVYKLDTIVSGGPDSTYRLCLEASNLPQDLITLEADDSGKLVGLFVSGSDNFNVFSGQIFSGSIRSDKRVTVSGSQFASLGNELLSSSINNFQKQYILSSPDLFDKEHDSFETYPKTKVFEITKNKPINSKNLQEINIDAVESLFLDKRLSNLPNFDFLPPVNKLRPGEKTHRLLSTYANLGQRPYLSQQDVLKEIDAAAGAGYQQEVTFTETSKENNLLCQFFEVAENKITKLDVIDFGSFPVDSNGISRHVFFAGKVFVDAYGVTTYVNIFTLVFESL